MIEALGARAVVADAFDAEALRRAVVAAKPDVVIHQLTDLPDVSDPRRWPPCANGIPACASKARAT